MELEIRPMIGRDFLRFLFLIGNVSRLHPVIICAAFIPAFFAGLWWSMIKRSDPNLPSSGATVENARAAITAPITPRPEMRTRRFLEGDLLANEAGALSNQRVLMFGDRDAMDAFLSNPGSGILVLSTIDSLNAVRVAFGDMAKLADALASDATEGMLFPVNLPVLTPGQVQDGAVALGAGMLKWLGVDRDHRNWGKGVKVAVLDTGVMGNVALGSAVRSIDLVPSSQDSSSPHGHATAVASTIVGKLAAAPGVAPAADIISVRVADDRGRSDSFLLASGIVEAVNAGAELINISMGGLGDSPVLRQAVEYAMEHGALVVAASGNNGIEGVLYPAALSGVVAVGAVDAMGEHLDFSNTGEQVDITAPGYGVRSVWVDGSLVEVSGTSFSAPIVTGALAAIMTDGSDVRLSAKQAWELMQKHLNDGGIAGVDPMHGAGMPDLGRVMNRNEAGRYDAAVGSVVRLDPDPSHPYGQVEVLVQNRGTETLLNTTVRISGDGPSQLINLNQLAPGQVQTVKLPITRSLHEMAEGYRVESRVQLGQGIQDIKPDNDQRQVILPAGR